MGRRSSGLSLVLGVAKAINRATKEAERNRLRQLQEEAKTLLANRRAVDRHFRESERMEAARVRAFEKARKEQSRELERIRQKREADAIKQEKDAEKREALAAKAAERQRKEVERQAKAAERDRLQEARQAIEVELAEGQAMFQERCDERRALRMQYVRTTLN